MSRIFPAEVWEQILDDVYPHRAARRAEEAAALSVGKPPATGAMPMRPITIPNFPSIPGASVTINVYYNHPPKEA